MERKLRLIPRRNWIYITRRRERRETNRSSFDRVIEESRVFFAENKNVVETAKNTQSKKHLEKAAQN